MRAAGPDELLHVLPAGFAVGGARVLYHGQVVPAGEADHVPLVHQQHWANHLQAGLVQLRHRREALAAPLHEQVHHQRLDKVVLVVSVGDLPAAQLEGFCVQRALAHLGTQTAGVLFLALLKDDLVDVGFHMMEGHIQTGAEVRHGGDGLRGHTSPHVHVDGMEREGDRVKLAQRRQPHQQAQAVLTAGKPHGDAVALRDHGVALDRLP